MSHKPCAVALCVLSVLAALALPTSVQAEERVRVYVRYTGANATALSASAARFEATLLESSAVELAGGAEMEAVYADCAEDLGVNAETRRECQLRAANRLFVDHVIEVEASATADGHHELALSVWNPASNAKIHAAVVEVDERDLERAMRTGLPLLASRYRCFRGEQSHCERSLTSTQALVVPTGRKVRDLATQQVGDEESCPQGQTVSSDTEGRCCWPGQVWSGQRCVGTPTRCPDGMLASGEEQACVLSACTEGQVRASDGIHCCWPGQGWSSSRDQCVGAPICPAGLTQLGEACVRDQDGDGILDEVDQCVAEAEDFDGFQDGDGCPDIDIDGDGIPDELDRCPYVAEDLDGFEDDDGCRELHDLNGVIGWSLVGTGLAVVVGGLVYEGVTNPDLFEGGADDATTTTESASFSVASTIAVSVGVLAAGWGVYYLLLPEEIPDLTVSTDGQQAFVQWRTTF